MDLLPNPFDLQVTVVPVNALQIQVRAHLTRTLLGNPVALVWQEGADAPITVTLAYNAGLGQYTGLAALDPAAGTDGHVRVPATDSQGRTVEAMAPFRIEEVTANEGTIVRSPDGVVELVLPPNSLSANAVVSIQQSSVGSTEQDGLRVVGAPYEILVSSGQSTLNATAYLQIHYPSMSAGVLTPTLGIYRWNNASQRWIALGGTVDDALYWVSAPVNQLSVFAILGQPAPTGRQLYLPVLLKRR